MHDLLVKSSRKMFIYFFAIICDLNYISLRFLLKHGHVYTHTHTQHVCTCNIRLFVPSRSGHAKMFGVCPLDRSYGHVFFGVGRRRYVCACVGCLFDFLTFFFFFNFHDYDPRIVYYQKKLHLKEIKIVVKMLYEISFSTLSFVVWYQGFPFFKWIVVVGFLCVCVWSENILFA